jgi:beta-galactosidase
MFTKTPEKLFPMKRHVPLIAALLLNGLLGCSTPPRTIDAFNNNWKFQLGEKADAWQPGFDDSEWRSLDLPHDWSIEGSFSKDNPSTPGGGALPGGIGWYRKRFTLPEQSVGKCVFIEFDGVYQESEVWINGHSLGFRPNGYISFRYELTGHLHRGDTLNVIAVRVDNSHQPNSRWYSGSGIYRDVRLVITDPVQVDHWGVFVTTPSVTAEQAEVHASTTVRNSLPAGAEVEVTSRILDGVGRQVAAAKGTIAVSAGVTAVLDQDLQVPSPRLWSVEEPSLYSLVTEVRNNGRLTDRVETPFGIRTFRFDAQEGFFLNGKPMKLQGVCNHHDLGALGAAAFPRAMERQLELLKEMGCNAIRTSHNPPSPVLLDLCDRMGFVVMDETFDMWKRRKTPFDYHLFWDEWHQRDLTDHVLRDRNHPSVVLWSIGNEIPEQGDSSGTAMAIELAGLVRQVDPTRPITSGCNNTSANNFINRSGALDVIGFNYHQNEFPGVPEMFPGMPFIATETTSALATRGHYDMPSDSVRIWPLRFGRNAPNMNPDNTCSAYDNCRVPWGSTHEEALLAMNQNEFVSGMFVWTGFDYLGEPTPYWWPSRSSYFGILDLAGFPKDAYYLYKSEWTGQPVLHLFPHWNWEEGDTIDVWTFTSCDEVELFLNGTSLGVRKKPEGSLHMQWRVPYAPGRLVARGMWDGQVLEDVVETTGSPAALRLTADREAIGADPMDLSFVTVSIVDQQGREVPTAGNHVTFSLEGEGAIVGVDNGLQTSMEPFKAEERDAFNGRCLAILRSGGSPGTLRLTARSEGLEPAVLEIPIRAL